MAEISFYPVWLSIKVALTATTANFFIGTFLAYLLSRYDFFGKNLFDAIIMQPLIMPPTVLGYYLLVLLGRQSFIGRFLEDYLGVTLVFTWQGAALAAMVASLPLFIKPVRAAIESVSSHIEDSARILGKNEWQVFRHITFPLARGGIVAGTALAFARSLGEFGTTLMVAGNIPGKTQTVSIAIYDAVQAGNTAGAQVLVGLITIISVVILYTVNRVVTRKY